MAGRWRGAAAVWLIDRRSMRGCWKGAARALAGLPRCGAGRGPAFAAGGQPRDAGAGGGHGAGRPGAYPHRRTGGRSGRGSGRLGRAAGGMGCWPTCRSIARWCMIHCTQMTPAETAALAAHRGRGGALPDHRGEPWRRHLRRARLAGARAGASGVGIGQQRPHLAGRGTAAAGILAALARPRAGRCMADAGTVNRAVLVGGRGGGRRAGGGARRRARSRSGDWADLLALDTGDVRLEGLRGRRAP